MATVSDPIEQPIVNKEEYPAVDTTNEAPVNPEEREVEQEQEGDDA